MTAKVADNKNPSFTRLALNVQESRLALKNFDRTEGLIVLLENLGCWSLELRRKKRNAVPILSSDELEVHLSSLGVPADVLFVARRRYNWNIRNLVEDLASSNFIKPWKEAHRIKSGIRCDEILVLLERFVATFYGKYPCLFPSLRWYLGLLGDPRSDHHTAPDTRFKEVECPGSLVESPSPVVLQHKQRSRNWPTTTSVTGPRRYRAIPTYRVPRLPTTRRTMTTAPTTASRPGASHPAG
jgi:hypothetical protein